MSSVQASCENRLFSLFSQEALRFARVCPVIAAMRQSGRFWDPIFRRIARWYQERRLIRWLVHDAAGVAAATRHVTPRT